MYNVPDRYSIDTGNYHITLYLTGIISINAVLYNITMYLIGKFLDASLIFTDSFNGVAALPLLKFNFSFQLPHLNETNVLKHLNETNVLKHLDETNVLRHLLF